MKKMLIVLLTLTAFAGNLFARHNSCDNSCPKPCQGRIAVRHEKGCFPEPEQKMCQKTVYEPANVERIVTEAYQDVYSCPAGCSPCEEVIEQHVV